MAVPESMLRMRCKPTCIKQRWKIVNKFLSVKRDRYFHKLRRAGKQEVFEVMKDEVFVSVGGQRVPLFRVAGKRGGQSTHRRRHTRVAELGVEVGQPALNMRSARLNRFMMLSLD